MTDPLPYDEQFQDAFGPGVIGDNKPPEDVDPVRDRLAENYAELIARHSYLLAAEAERVPEVIEDEETAKDVSDYEGDLSKCLKALEGARVSEKEPFLTAGRAVDGFFGKLAGNPKGPWTSPSLNATKARTNDALTIFGRKKRDAERKRREEEERLAREAAEQARQEAEALDAAAMAAQAAQVDTEKALDIAVEAENRAEQAEADLVKAERASDAGAAELSRGKSDKGTGFGLVAFWDYRGLDRSTIDLEALRPHLPEEAIISAVKSFIKAGGHELEGVHIFENTRNRTRHGR